MANVLNPVSTSFSMHSHDYVAPYVPNPFRAHAIYQFDGEVNVSGIDMGMHSNGINKIEGFIGDSLGSLVSLGVVSGSLGNGPFSERSNNFFAFSSSASGSIFQIVVRETSLHNGWANYWAIPQFDDASPVPDAGPGAAGLAVLAASIYSLRRRR